MIKYSEFLKNKYGEKVYKIPVNIGGTCPNRDGTKGVGGCIFCSDIGAGFELLDENMPILEQIEKNIAYIKKKYKANKYIIYFQNFTGTYMPLEHFQYYINLIKQIDNVVGIAVSTRPDCLDFGHLDILKDCQNDYDIYIELGLQSANNDTLKKINRCHTVGDFIDGAKKVKAYGFYLDVHIILNLPWDSLEDVVRVGGIVNEVQADSVKLHSLNIPYGTKLYDMYLNNEFKIIQKEAYFLRLKTLLSLLDDKIAVQRLFSRAAKEKTLFCNWGISWWKLEDEFYAYLDK